MNIITVQHKTRARPHKCCDVSSLHTHTQTHLHTHIYDVYFCTVSELHRNNTNKRQKNRLSCHTAPVHIYLWDTAKSCRIAKRTPANFVRFVCIFSSLSLLVAADHAGTRVCVCVFLTIHTHACRHIQRASTRMERQVCMNKRTPRRSAGKKEPPQHELEHVYTVWQRRTHVRACGRSDHITHLHILHAWWPAHIHPERGGNRLTGFALCYLRSWYRACMSSRLVLTPVLRSQWMLLPVNIIRLIYIFNKLIHMQTCVRRGVLEGYSTLWRFWFGSCHRTRPIFIYPIFTCISVLWHCHFRGDIWAIYCIYLSPIWRKKNICNRFQPLNYSFVRSS